MRQLHGESWTSLVLHLVLRGVDDARGVRHRCARHRWTLKLQAMAVIACIAIAEAPAQSLELNQYAHRAWRTSDLALARGAQRSKFAQTPDGYLWLGTIIGLYRFDGVRAVRFTASSDGTRLRSRSILSLHTSRDGTLWIAGDSGLATLRDGRLTINRAVGDQQVNSVFEDSRGVIWVGLRVNTWKGYGVSPRLCTIRDEVLDCHREERFGSVVRDVFEDRRGSIWVVSSAGVWRWAPGNPQYFPIEVSPTTALHATEDEDGAIIAASDRGLKRYVNGEFRPYQLPGVNGRFGAGKLFRSRDGSLWISSPDYGLYHVFGGKTDRFSSADGLSSDQVYGFFEDTEGNVWVETASGIDQFRPVAAPRLPSKMGLSSATVWSVLATADSSVWLATPAGLNRWRDGRVTVYAESPRGDRSSDGALRSVASGGAHSPVYSLGQDASGRVWASTRHGIARQNNGRFNPVDGGLPSAAIAITGDRQGNVWVNYQFVALHAWTPRSGTVRRVLEFKEQGRYTMAALTSDSKRGGVWASQQGVGLVYLDSGRIQSTYTPPTGPGSPSNDLRMGSDGVLWSGSADGLMRIKDRQSATLSARNGLPCNFVHWSIEDDLGWLWMRMSCGLVRVSLREVEAWVRDSSRRIAVQRFSRYAAFTDDQYGAKFWYRPAVTKARDGRIWFADVEGAGVIDPRIVRFNDRPPPVYIESISADSTAYDPATNVGGSLRIPPRVRNLRIEFTALSLALPERVRFRFKLDGQDDEWREALNQRSVEYSNLSPGTYRFRVMAANSYGVWNTTGSTVEFTIDPAWNQSWWFFVALITSIAVTAGGAAVAWQHRRSRAAAERVQAQFDATLAERTRVARELHDTLLGDMAGMAMQLSAGAKRAGSSASPDPNVVDLLSSLSKQVQHSLVAARRAVTAMRKEASEDARPLHAQLATAAQRTFAQSGIVANIEHLGSPTRYPLHVEDEIVGIATESMMNARKHANCNAVAVTCRYAPHELSVSVRDDGCGFDASHAAPEGHWGLIGMRERAASIGATLAVWSSPSNGTEVAVVLPLVTS